MVTHGIPLTDFPQAPGVVLRPFSGAEDFAAMAAVANASSAADGIQILRTPESMARDYAAFTACDPLQDCILAELGGEMVGYGRCWRVMLTDGLTLHAHIGFVPRHWRGRGIGRLLQNWIEQRNRAVARTLTQGTHVHHAYAQQGEDARARLLQASGYAPVRYFFEMLQTQLHAVPDFPMPEGLELRPVLPEHYRAIWEAHHTAFEHHWGMAIPTSRDYSNWLESKVFQPARWQVAWEGDEVAGQVRTFINEDENRNLSRRRGYTEFISVGSKWRRRGLARALIARSLRLLAGEGMSESALEVDSENMTGANRVYADCGFDVVKRGAVYRKPLAL
jgi:GNAT superfamily N-acetyltransferase